MAGTTKRLTRVQLINWHYFENERISFNGSTLISGENTSGKSTILDAIQLVLTTNSRHFNMAANENGKRDLRGYVRCKTGDLGDMYLRKNTVPANVALEFYEEKGDRYFVLGVHLLSNDEESNVVKKWYREECRLEDLSFIVDSHAALDKEFKNRGRKIKYIESDKAARDEFRHRLGNLEDKFFEIIPKSLAFKPMNNVKEFINKFVLTEEHINIDELKGNIESLGELERLLDRSNRQLGALDDIISRFDDIEQTDRNLKITDILIMMADVDALKERMENAQSDIRFKQQTIESDSEQLRLLQEEELRLQDMIIQLNVSIKQNDAAALLEDARRRKTALEKDIERIKEQEKKLKQQTDAIKEYLRALAVLDQRPLTKEDLDVIGGAYEASEKNKAIEKLAAFELKEGAALRETYQDLNYKRKTLDNQITDLQEKQAQLNKRQLSYPPNTVKLKNAIEREFKRRNIHSDVYILAELLEIKDSRWADAVEGYLNTQRFYLVVEPEYYDAALDIYHKHKNEVHSAGLINTKKIPLNTECDPASLAFVVGSENRYAKAFARYVLGRVIRCDDIHELENHEIGITDDCMLYQNFVVRHLNPEIYKNPYIGGEAWKVQVANVRARLEELSLSRSKIRDELVPYAQMEKAALNVNPALCREYMNAPTIAAGLKEQLIKAKSDEASAQNDPTLIELQTKLSDADKNMQKLKAEQSVLQKSQARLEEALSNLRTGLAQMEELHKVGNEELQKRQDEAGGVYHEAKEKYAQNRKSKKPEVIKNNFSPRMTQLQNEKTEAVDLLKQKQYQYNVEFTEDMTVGVTFASEYREAAAKLRTVEKVKYEEKLKKAMEDCEEIFRSDFLSRMKEYIEAARKEFRDLNRALENIYYGEDSYHFKIMPDKKKEGLYKMITSENNVEGSNTLWSSMFEEEYREEIKELFDKLTAHDDNGQKVVDEYTDYRSYLDYDIEIHKKNGKVQRFSDIYGEKSGSETQVPYYVAIAASFYQLYRFDNSIRLMLLDEAFDKMDDDRIQSMMEFFKSLKLQTVMATPPPKIETIGEHVDTILTVIRAGSGSIVEEYDL